MEINGNAYINYLIYFTLPILLIIIYLNYSYDCNAMINAFWSSIAAANAES